MNISTYVYTDNSLSALLKDLSSHEEHQILGGTKISAKPVCKSKVITKANWTAPHGYHAKITPYPRPTAITIADNSGKPSVQTRVPTIDLD
ncbi:hypothetical protein [Nostoc sp.]